MGEIFRFAPAFRGGAAPLLYCIDLKRVCASAAYDALDGEQDALYQT
jgi:hypothetical protein